MVYPTIHCPDTQAHQNVIVIAVVGGYHDINWKDLTYLWYYLLYEFLSYQVKIKKKTHDWDQNSLFTVEVCEITLFTVNDQYTTYHRASNSRHCPFPHHSHLH
jgi:hypothetical protein